MTDRPIMPGGGAYGRSAKLMTRNPILALPSAQTIRDLPPDQRRPLGILLRELAVQADAKCKESIHRKKLPMALYWGACAVYAKHLARAIDPRPGAKQIDARDAA
ncbi:MAG: hypothetical protein JWO51_97 [Rhodospirillales bacterium]|nr:hypothetical protein [Rhodospirillales bacterium]